VSSQFVAYLDKQAGRLFFLIAAASIPSSWQLIIREWMRRGDLTRGQADEAMRAGQPRYYEREGFQFYY